VVLFGTVVVVDSGGVVLVVVVLVGSGSVVDVVVVLDDVVVGVVVDVVVVVDDGSGSSASATLDPSSVARVAKIATIMKSGPQTRTANCLPIRPQRQHLVTRARKWAIMQKWGRTRATIPRIPKASQILR